MSKARPRGLTPENFQKVSINISYIRIYLFVLVHIFMVNPFPDSSQGSWCSQRISLGVLTMWPYDQTNRTAFPSLDEEVRGEANSPSRRASSAPWDHPGTRVLCLVVHLTTNAFSPVGKEKEEVKVNAFQGWGAEFAHIPSVGFPLTITLSHGLSTLEGGLNMPFLQRGKRRSSRWWINRRGGEGDYGHSPVSVTDSVVQWAPEGANFSEKQLRSPPVDSRDHKVFVNSFLTRIARAVLNPPGLSASGSR